MYERQYVAGTAWALYRVEPTIMQIFRNNISFLCSMSMKDKPSNQTNKNVEQIENQETIRKLLSNMY